MPKLSDRINMAMRAKGCTVTELADACKIKPPSVCDWMNGKTATMKAATGHRAAAYLEVEFLWLTEGVGRMRSSDPAVPVAREPAAPAYNHPNPHIQKLIKALEDTDDFGRGLAIGAALQMLKDHKPSKEKAA